MSTTPPSPRPLPKAVEQTLRHFWTCEFTTLAKDGTPITWPVYPMFLAKRGQILIASPIGYPQKAIHVRRNRRVSLLYSEPTGSGLSSPARVLIQGTAEAPDIIHTSSDDSDPEIFAEVLGQIKRVMKYQPNTTMYLANPITQWLMDWYFMRLTILVTPTRICWWADEDFSQTPQEWSGEREADHVG